MCANLSRVSPCVRPVTAGTGCLTTCDPEEGLEGNEDEWMFSNPPCNHVTGSGFFLHTARFRAQR